MRTQKPLAHKAESIYCLAFCRKHLPTPVLYQPDLCSGAKVRLRWAERSTGQWASPTGVGLDARSTGQGSRWDRRWQQGKKEKQQQGVARNGDRHGPKGNFIHSKLLPGAGSNLERGGAPGLLRQHRDPPTPCAYASDNQSLCE